MEEEKKQLYLCRQKIEQLLKWGDSQSWGNEEYEELKLKIFEKTQVQLSISTLKRIWGKVQYESSPAITTLNALACFAGYNSWRDFKLHHQGERVSETGIGLPVTKSNEESGKTRDGQNWVKPQQIWYSKYTWIVTGIIFLMISIYLISVRKKETHNLETVTFTSRKTTDDLPNSVVFNFTTGASNPDSIFIQQSWDPDRRERLSVNTGLHTSIYYNPGYFLAKLVVNNIIKKEAIVFIKTKGWKGIITKIPVPVYLSEQEIKGNGHMGITGSVLYQKTGSPVFNDTWVKFSNVKEYSGIDAGNFTLSTTLRNTSTPEQSVCRKTNLVILGTGKAMIIPLADKGCTADIGLLNNEDWITGKNTDLSAFGCDFKHFQNLKCQVKSGRMKVYLNNKQIFNTAQKRTLGRIVGIRFEFEGSGEVKDVKLETPGAPVFEEHF